MRKGFTLIELLVFIAIIGILSSVAISFFSKGNDKVEKCMEKAKISCDRLKD